MAREGRGRGATAVVVIALALLFGAAEAEALNVNPGSLTFGKQRVRTTSAPQAVTLTGCALDNRCVMSSVSGNFSQGFTTVCPSSTGAFVQACVPSSDFRQTNDCPPSGFPPGGSCTMWIFFRPDRAGARAATLQSGYDLIPTPLSNPAGAKVFVGGYGVKKKKKKKKGAKKRQRHAAQSRQE